MELGVTVFVLQHVTCTVEEPQTVGETVGHVPFGYILRTSNK
jgi:hypothetical protein